MTDSKKGRGQTVVDEGAAIIFVHGLSGNTRKTWGRMLDCFRNDSAFKDYTLDYYAYPSSKFRWPFTPQLPDVRALAEGLRTYLEEKHSRRKEICIVAHSLGGLIARQYITSEIRDSIPLRIKQLVLIAAPNTGSSLASIGSILSFHHNQLKALTRDNDGLTQLNADWARLGVEEKIQVRYIVGGMDSVVAPESGAPLSAKRSTSTLIDCDHRTIIQPNDCADIRFLTLRRFINPQGTLQSPSGDKHKTKPAIQPDPLFDIYSTINEPFYIERDMDITIRNAMSSGNIWISGKSGVGKTAILKRTSILNGWHLNHLTLGAYECNDPIQVLRAICVELTNAINDSAVPPISGTVVEYSSYLRNILKKFPNDLVIANVIEEIPLPQESLAQLGNLISKLNESIRADSELSSRSIFAISSIHNIVSQAELGAKVREAIQFIEMGAWSGTEIRNLIDFLAPTYRAHLTDSERQQISTTANGSPRFIKMLFRHWKNGTDQDQSLDDLLKQVMREQIL